MTGSEAGSYLRLIDFVYHATLGLRVIKKKMYEMMTSMESRRERKTATGLSLAFQT